MEKHKYTHFRVLLATTKFKQKFYRTAIIPYTFVDVDYIDRNTSVSYEKGRSAHASDWYFWDLRTMLRFSSDDIFIAVGYGISNLDIYSSCRSMSVEGTSFNSVYPSKKLNHSIFIKVGATI